MTRPRGAALVNAPFSNSRVKTALPAEDRFALAALREDEGQEEACQETVRRVISAGLAALGWSPERRIQEYAAYRAQCVRKETINEFESR